MFRGLVLGAVVFALLMNSVFAAVEVNTAERPGLDGIKGVGPKLSKAILAERASKGQFKSWEDLESRVHGIGSKSAVKLSKAGLVVNGQPRDAADKN